MRRVHQSGDRGQTLPMYVVVVGGLLFLAFVYFAFAQAAVARNGGQSAADAAALAAAQDVRDELTQGFFDDIANPETLADWLDAKGFEGSGEGAAAQLAASNRSDLSGIQFAWVQGDPAFTANIETQYTVGKSLLPGTEGTHARAHATAVIEPLCAIAPDADLAKLVVIDCRGSGVWELDPKDIADVDPGALPKAKDLFSVHLAEGQ
ncbi:pilus assembly protein TadG-related protein [Streptomyces sp. NPDC091272]|uniref:pilus assembly protein TadG-related protein n=1 Tax=Streptomyces sp. NPDC091272 TaxID=3365981 RepID=UPI0037FCDC54